MPDPGARVCPACGTSAAADWSYCNRCGEPLAGAIQRPPVPAAASPEHAYFDRDVSGVARGSSDQDLVLAGAGKRFVALILDIIFTGVIGGVITAAGFVFLGRPLASLVNLLFSIAYYTFGNGSGGTWGAKIMNLRVVNARGEAPGPGAGFVRWLVSLASGIVFLLGYLWMLWDDKKQTWHDKAAGTYVVETA